MNGGILYNHEVDIFIEHSKGSNEPNLIILNDPQHIETTLSELSRRDFVGGDELTIEDIAVLLMRGTNLVISSKTIAQNSEAYFDLFFGYCSGNVRVHDKMLPLAIEKNTIILVMPRSYIEEERENGRDWLSLCGMALQYDVLGNV